EYVVANFQKVSIINLIGTFFFALKSPFIC
ncbi:MAG: hypothetical protein ACI8SA_002544, partial [Dokdonia sp.]